MAQVTTNTTTDLNLWQQLQTASSGGGGGATVDVAGGINASADIDTIITRLNDIKLATVQSTAVPLAQITLSIVAGATANYVIPANCRSLTICITSGSLVHYTEDGSVPTTNNCWFGYGSKEIWDTNIPAGSTLKLLATSAATVVFQPRT